MLGTFHDDTIVVVVDKLEGSHEVAVESHIELRWRSRTLYSCISVIRSIVHGAQPMARALRRVGSAHRAPSGPRCARHSLSLFAVLSHLYRKCTYDSHNEPTLTE